MYAAHCAAPPDACALAHPSGTDGLTACTALFPARYLSPSAILVYRMRPLRTADVSPACAAAASLWTADIRLLLTCLALLSTSSLLKHLIRSGFAGEIGDRATERPLHASIASLGLLDAGTGMLSRDQSGLILCRAEITIGTVAKITLCRFCNWRSWEQVASQLQQSF